MTAAILQLYLYGYIHVEGCCKGAELIAQGFEVGHGVNGVGTLNG